MSSMRQDSSVLNRERLAALGRDSAGGGMASAHPIEFVRDFRTSEYWRFGFVYLRR
jgi:hypothetical protein